MAAGTSLVFAYNRCNDALICSIIQVQGGKDRRQIIAIGGDTVKRLYEAQNNYTNYLIIEDTDRSRVFDWDLCEDEVADFAARFERGEITDADANSDKWEDGNSAFDGLFNIKLLASID